MATTIPPLPLEKSQMFLAVLAGATTLVAAVALLLELTTTLEAVSFVTGALCVWLVVRENVWNFPIGLVNVAVFSVVFFQSRLFADAGLQVVYFVLGIMGWTLWLRGGENKTRLSLSRIGRVESAWLGFFVVVKYFVPLEDPPLRRRLGVVLGCVNNIDQPCFTVDAKPQAIGKLAGLDRC